jgi:ankyrin repeat protein
MPWLKRLMHSSWRIIRPGGVILGVGATLVGFLVDVIGTSTFLSLSQDEWIQLGLVLIAGFGALIVLRHEYLISEMDNIWANEHRRSLYRDGIWPTRDEYFNYIRNGNYGIVNRFWKSALVNICDRQNRWDLHIAAEAGHAAIVRGIIEHGGDPRIPDRAGRTPLMEAASRGKIDAIRVLLEHDCALNASATEDGVSALYAAVANGHSAVVELLIESGAKIDLPDHDNITPLLAAIAQSNWTIAERLLVSGADIKKIDASGASIADYVAEMHDVPQSLTERISNIGLTTNTNIRRTGHGHKRTGKVTVHWAERTDE